jgi:hypothetical protein
LNLFLKRVNLVAGIVSKAPPMRSRAPVYWGAMKR